MNQFQRVSVNECLAPFVWLTEEVTHAGGALAHLTAAGVLTERGQRCRHRGSGGRGTRAERLVVGGDQEECDSRSSTESVTLSRLW